MDESRKILTVGMSDSERYELLKDRTIAVPFVNAEKLAQIDADEYAALERIGRSGAFKILRKIGEDFGGGSTRQIICINFTVITKILLSE